jgi:predicted GH43/DUF377 family glycosyl hydrolase
MWSHAANPTVERLDGTLVRVYFSTRDRRNRSAIGYLEFDVKAPKKNLFVSPEPVVRPGAVGLFDDSGTSVACIVRSGSRKLLFYLGWNLGVTVPWRNSIGLAIADGPDGRFIKYSAAPILDRSAEDPYSLSYPWVVRNGNSWRMWYGSNLAWGSKPQEMEHVIKVAESSDGIRWSRRGDIAVHLHKPSEIGLSRPCVIWEDGLFRMWYSIREDHYRIGYAESADGIIWQRKDTEVGIGVSGMGWDSESVEYPCVFDVGDQRYMLYNGNGYGKTGFGMAVLSEGQ